MTKNLFWKDGAFVASLSLQHELVGGVGQLQSKYQAYPFWAPGSIPLLLQRYKKQFTSSLVTAAAASVAISAPLNLLLRKSVEKKKR